MSYAKDQQALATLSMLTQQLSPRCIAIVSLGSTLIVVSAFPSVCACMPGRRGGRGRGCAQPVMPVMVAIIIASVASIVVILPALLAGAMRRLHG